MRKYVRLFESEDPKISKIETSLFDEIKEVFDENMNIYSINDKDAYYLSFSKKLDEENVIEVFQNLESLDFTYFKELTENEKKKLGIIGNTIVEVLPN
jgi:hypothetical protein